MARMRAAIEAGSLGGLAAEIAASAAEPAPMS
jgi:hypothetical protein